MALVNIGNQYVSVDKIEAVLTSSRGYEPDRIAVVLTSGRIVREDIPEGVEPDEHLRAVVNRINLNA